MNRLTQNDTSKDNYLDYLNSQIESSKAKEREFFFNKIKPQKDKLNELGDRLKDLRESKLSIKNLWKRASIRINIWKEQANLNNLRVTQTKYYCTTLLFQSVKDQVNEGLIGIGVILKNANATLKKIHNLKNKDLWKVDHAFKHTHKEDVERLRSEIRGDESAANKNGSSNITNDAPETNIQTDKEGILPDNIDAKNRTGNPQNTSPEETTTFTTSTLGDPENSAGQPDNEIQDEASKGVNSEENLGDVLPKEAHPEGDESGEIDGSTAKPVLDGVTPESAKVNAQTKFVRTLLTGLLQPDSEKRTSALDAAKDTDKFINSQTDGNPTNSGVDTKGSKTPENPASPAAEETLGSIADSSALKDEGEIGTKKTTTSTPTHTDATSAPTKVISAEKVDASKSEADIEAQKDKFVKDAVTALQGNGIGPNDIEVFKEILGEIRKDNTEMSPTDFQKEVNREMKYLYQIKGETNKAKKINTDTNFKDMTNRVQRYNSGPKNQSAATKPSTEVATRTKKAEASDKADATTEVDTEGKDKAVENQINRLNQDLEDGGIEKLTEAEERIFRNRLNKFRQDKPNISLYEFNEHALSLGDKFYSIKSGKTSAEVQEIKAECCKAAIENGLENSFKDDKITLSENDKTKFRERLNSVMRDNPNMSLMDFKAEVGKERGDLWHLKQLHANPTGMHLDNSKISIAREYGYNEIANFLETTLNPEERSATLEGTTDKDAPTSGTDVTKTTTTPTVSATTISNSEIKNVLDAITAKGKELIQTAKQLGKGTFGTVFAVSVEALGKTLNIVVKTMNSAKEIAAGEATSSKNLNNLQTVLNILHEYGSISFGENTSVSEGLAQCIAILSQYEKAYRGEAIATRINQLKTKLTELKDKASQLEFMRDNLKKNPQLEKTLKTNISETEKEFEKIAKTIKSFTPEELNTLNNADALLDLYQEIYVNAKINMEIIRKTKGTGQTPLEYAEAHHIPLCLSAMPDDEQVIPDDQLMDFARKKAHEVLKSDNKAIIFTQIPGENLNKCFQKAKSKEPSKLDKLSMKARVKVVQDFFTATKLLNAAGIYHNDLHFGNMQVNVIDENNAEGYILDFGRAVEANGKNYDFFEHNFIGSKDARFSPPEMFIEGADTNKITNPEGLDKCAIYGLGANLFSLLGGDEGLKVQNRYLPRTGIKPNPKEPQAVWNFLDNKTKNIKENIEKEINSKSEDELITLFLEEKIKKLKAEAREVYGYEPEKGELLGYVKEALVEEQVIAQVLASDVLFPEEKEMYSFFTGQKTKDPEGTKNEIVKLSQKLYFQDIEKNVKEVFKEQSPEIQDKIIALMKGTTEIDPERRMTLSQAQESLDELKLLIDPEQNRTEQNVNNRSTESKEISAGKPIDSSEISPASLSSSEEQPVDDVTAIINPTTVSDTEFQPLAEPITKDCYTITKVATESVGAGSFGTVFKVMANVAENIAGKAQEVQAALKRMNGNTNELSRISSYFKYAIDQLNDPSVSDEQKEECLAGVKQNIEYLLKNYNKGSIQKQLQSFSRTLQKLPQRDPRIQKFKSDTANLLSKNVPQNLENLEKNLLSKLNDTTAVIYAQEWAADIEKITNVLDSVNLEGEFEKLKDASREIFNNAYMYAGMLEKAKEEGLSPLEYAAKHNITLCFSAIPSDEKLNELNSITDENQKKTMLLKWSYETAQKILENPDDGLLFSLVPGKSMASIGYDEINKLSPQGKLGILDGFFQTMEELDKLGLIHNDAHEGNVNVDIKDENNAKGYVFDHGISVLTSDPNQFHDVSARTHRPIISPNIRNGNPNGPKDNSYAIGMKIPQTYLGIEGQKLYNQYFVNFEKLAEFGLVNDSFIQQIKQDKCNVWEINERLQKAGVNLDEIYNFLQESFYQELKDKIQKGISSKKGAFGHDTEACKILDRLLETLNPDFNERITSAEARTLIEELKKHENSKVA